MPNKRIEQVCQTTDINGNDKLLVVKSGSNVTRSVTVDNFIHENSINTGEISNCAITEPKIANCAITTRHLKASIITSDNIDSTGITANCITTGTLDASNVNVTNLDASNITTGTLDANNVNVTNINANNITTGTLDADRIGAIDISACNLNADRITTGILDADRIEADSIHACKLCTCSIKADQIDANAITACKIAAGAIASSTQIVCGVIDASHINSNSVITNTIQSDNFDGTLVDGEYTVGTQGFSMNASTGTLVLNSLVARNNIIAGNYICYNEEGGFAVDSNGNFKVAVDNNTLTIGGSGLSIKTIPETAVVAAASDINYTGGHNVIDMGRYGINPQGSISLGPYLESVDSWATNSWITSGAAPFLVVPLLSSDGGPLNSGASQIQDLDIYNITFIVDYSNVGNLADATQLSFSLRGVYSDINTGFQNTPLAAGKSFIVVRDPILPLGEVEYTIPSFSVFESILSIGPNSTNEYLIIYPNLYLKSDDSGPGFTGYITMSAKASLDSRLIIGATGEYTNPNRNFSDIIVGAQ